MFTACSKTNRLQLVVPLGGLEVQNFSSRVDKCFTRREILYLRAAM